VVIDYDRKDGFEIDTITWRGVLRAYAIDQSERNVSACLHCIRRGRRRLAPSLAEGNSGCDQNPRE
jgi:hypothetical protein